MEDKQIENIHLYIYLDAKSQCDGYSRADVKHRMVIAQEALCSLYHLWNGSHLPLFMKLHIHRTAVCQILAHSCEACVLSKDVPKYINGFTTVEASISLQTDSGGP